MVTVPKPGEVKEMRGGAKKGGRKGHEKAKESEKVPEGGAEDEKKMMHGKAWGYLVWRGGCSSLQSGFLHSIFDFSY